MSSVTARGSNDVAGQDVVLCFVPGTPGYNPSWYAMAAIGIDPVSGSDSNVGTIGSPIQHWSEAVRRWGSISPHIRQNLTITFLSSQPDNTDPVYFTPYIENGAYIEITSTLTQIATGTLSNVVALNRATPQLWNATMPAGTGINQLVVNTTSDGVAWTYKSLGAGLFSLSRPLTAVAVPSAIVPPLGAIVWGNGDTVTVYDPAHVNFVQVEAQANTDIAAALNTFLYVYRVHGILPVGDHVDSLLHTQLNVRWYECIIDRSLNFTGTSDNDNFIFNSDLTNGLYNISGVTNVAVYGGMVQASANAMTGTAFAMQGDPILNINVLLNSFAEAAAQLGSVYIESGKTFSLIGGQLNGTFNREGGSPFLWGPGNLNIQLGRLLYPSGAGAATAMFLLKGTMKINSQTTAYSVGTGAGAVWNGGITISPANLDAAVGVAGFGGNAIVPGGGAIANFGP